MKHQLALIFAAMLFCNLCLATTVTVEIEGLKKELKENAYLFLSIEQQKNHPLLTPARIRRLHEKAPQQIEEALKPFGYYKPKIQTKLKEEKTDQWRAVYTVDAGKPLLIAKFDFSIIGEAKNDRRFKTLLATPTVAVGKPLDHIAYESLKTSLSNLSAELGYFDAKFLKHEIRINLEQYHALVRLEFDSGPRYHFGEVSLLQSVIEPEFMNRFIPFQEGDHYSVNSLLSLQQSLIDSDYFSIVEVEPNVEAHLQSRTP